MSVLEIARQTKWSSGPRRFTRADVRAGDRILSVYGTGKVQEAHRGMELALLTLDTGHQQLATFDALKVIEKEEWATARSRCRTFTGAQIGYVSPAYVEMVAKKRKVKR